MFQNKLLQIKLDKFSNALSTFQQENEKLTKQMETLKKSGTSSTTIGTDEFNIKEQVILLKNQMDELIKKL